MSDDKNTKTTPDGQTGQVLQWPIGASKHFREVTGLGLEQSTKTVGVVPLRLESGEVRFYDQDTLQP